MNMMGPYAGIWVQAFVYDWVAPLVLRAGLSLGEGQCLVHQPVDDLPSMCAEWHWEMSAAPFGAACCYPTACL